jgi:hypothetical protein
MLSLALIPLMSFLARASGAKWKFWGAELLFAIPLAYVPYYVTGSWLLSVLALAAAYFAFQTGHGNAFHMGTQRDKMDEPEHLDYLIVRRITNRLGLKPRSVGYCWVFMGIKGFLIGLAAFPFGLALALLWPLSYWVGFRFWKDSAPAEWISGAYAGLVVCLSLNFWSMV